MLTKHNRRLFFPKPTQRGLHKVRATLNAGILCRGGEPNKNMQRVITSHDRACRHGRADAQETVRCRQERPRMRRKSFTGTHTMQQHPPLDTVSDKNLLASRLETAARGAEDCCCSLGPRARRNQPRLLPKYYVRGSSPNKCHNSHPRTSFGVRKLT